jgi:hypothetical protein
MALANYRSRTAVDVNELSKLEVVSDAAGDIHDSCLPNTRVSILDYIRNWANESDSPPILWLTDVAGAGKSTVAKHMSDEWRRDGRLGGCFFFNKNQPEAANTKLFSETIAAQLSATRTQHPRIRLSIIEAIKSLDPTPSIYPFKERLEKLVMEQLKDLDLVLVVDALDECNERDRAILLKHLLSFISQGMKVKVFITSRPEPDIVTFLGPYQAHTDSLHDPILKSNQKDISIFVENGLGDLVLASILEREDVVRLASRVNCLFILASTACKVIQKSLDPRAMLEVLMNPQNNRLRHINNLYFTILEKACQVDDLEALEEEVPGPEKVIHEVLQVILVAALPLSIAAISSILDLKYAGHLIKRLSSVLSVKNDETVYILHPTFSEFLQDKKAAGSFYVNSSNAHHIMGKRCLAVMKKELKFNICQLKSSFYCNQDVTDFKDRIRKFISAGLQYGCVYWPFHILCSSIASAERDFTEKIAEIFDGPGALYWVEVLSALEMVFMGIARLQEIQNWLEVSELYI